MNQEPHHIHIKHWLMHAGTAVVGLVLAITADVLILDFRSEKPKHKYVYFEYRTNSNGTVTVGISDK